MCVFLLAAPPFVPPLSLCPLFQNGDTALIYASIRGHAKAVELLLAAKADPNLSLSAFSGWADGAHDGLVQRSRQSRGTPPRRGSPLNKVRPHHPQRERERKRKTPPPSTPTRALPPSRRGHMCPRGFGHEAPCNLPFGATSRFSGSPLGRGQNFDPKTVPESLASGATMIWAFVLHLYFGTFQTLWGLFFCVRAFCTRLAHVLFVARASGCQPLIGALASKSSCWKTTN